MQRNYYILDVFTDKAFTGNPLAAVIAADGLSTEQMQKIAAEFNLSETVFVTEPRDPVNSAAIRIFTPVAELPFAGHPTIGTAILLAQLRAPELLGRQDMSIVLESKIGAIQCTVGKNRGEAPRARFNLTQEPLPEGQVPDNAELARVLGLNANDIGFDNHIATIYSASLPYYYIPLKSKAIMSSLRPDGTCWRHIFTTAHAGVYLYTREVERQDSHFHTRMYFYAKSLIEDPATGSAAAGFSGPLHKFENLDCGEHGFILEQGFEMARPSIIHLGLTVENKKLVDAYIGGQAVRIAEGQIVC